MFNTNQIEYRTIVLNRQYAGCDHDVETQDEFMKRISRAELCAQDEGWKQRYTIVERDHTAIFFSRINPNGG